MYGDPLQRNARSSHQLTIGRFPSLDECFVAGLILFALSAGLLSGAVPANASIRSSDRVNGTSYSEVGVPKAAMPDVQMKAGALVTEDGRVLWSRNADDKRAVASLTKIMTAVVALENSTPDEIVTVPRASAGVGESTSFLRVGEKLPMSEMLEALLVKSGNDAAFTVAAHVAGGEEEFARLMNEKARELGLTGTTFKNSHGLDATGHRSTAADLAVLARYAMTKPAFREVVGQKTARIGSGARAEKVQNTNLLIGNYDGANGVKTGWTGDAGYCVVVSSRRGDIELYAVVLGAPGELQRFRDAKTLLDFGFAHYRPQRIASSGTVIGEAPVAEYIDRAAPAAVSQDTTVSVFDLAGPITRTVSVARVQAPVDAGQRVGVARFTQNGTLVASVPLVATVAVPDPSPLQRVGIALTRAWLRLSGAADDDRGP